MKNLRVKGILSASIMALAMTCGFVSTAVAHEGHPEAPGVLAPPHGGKIFAAAGMYIEFVRSQNDITIYAIDHDLKPVPVADVTLTLKLELPRVKEKATLTPTAQGDSWKVTVDPKGAHRYTLLASFKRKAKSGNVKFTVEN